MNFLSLLLEEEAARGGNHFGIQVFVLPRGTISFFEDFWGRCLNRGNSVEETLPKHTESESFRLATMQEV